MIAVQAAQNLIKENSFTWPMEQIPIQAAANRLLAQDIQSQREQPPFHRVAMDGIAINFEGKILKQYKIQDVQAAGSPKLTLQANENCIEVMTGSVLPENCNCVIPYEQVVIEAGLASLSINKLIEFQNIHPKGSDYQAGEIVCRRGEKITAPVCAVIASQGKSLVAVYKLPRIVIISTGSELVDMDQKIAEYQIYMSNNYAIEHELQNFGMKDITKLHIQDDQKTTFDKIADCLKDYDLLILTGGVSKGKFDFVPDTLDKLGVKKHFHKIRQKPGKPMWFGTLGEKQIFALPGNPVSSLVCLRRYVIPALLTTQTNAVQSISCVLTEEITFKREFTLFKPVSTVVNSKGELLATPIKANGSGDFYSLAKSSGFLELPAEKEVYKKGEIYQYYNWG